MATAAKPAGMSWAEWASSQPVQYTDSWTKGITAAAKELGYSGDIYSPEYRRAVANFYDSRPSAENGGGDSNEISSVPVSYNPALLQKLADYRFQSQNNGRHTGVNVTNAAGQNVGTWNVGNTGSSFDDFAYKAVPVGVGLLAGAALGGFIPGAEIGAAGGSGTAGGLIGAGEGASQLAAYSAANPLTAAQVTAATLPSAGLPGLTAGAAGATAGAGAGLLANEGAAQLAAYSAANPLTAAQVTAATLPAGGLPGLAAGAAGATPAVFNAAADSQLASSQLGITGAQSAAAATAPATVNLGSLGGTMGTAGGISGTLAGLKQQAADTLGGGLLGDAGAWMKANPVLGRLLMSGATSLLSASGGGGSSGGSAQAAAPMGPAQQWNSPIQQGLLAPVKQYAPPAVQRNPGGLLAAGFQNDGAWRYMGG